MINPEEYRKSIEELELDDLVKERHLLYREIRRFETNKITEEEKMTRPSPLTIYEYNNEYLVEVTKLIHSKVNELRDLIDINKTIRLNYKDTGFRAIYNNFVAYPLNKQLKSLVKDFPQASKANCVLAYGYIDKDVGLTLDIIACGKKRKDGFLFYDAIKDTRVIVRIGALIDEDFYYINDEDHTLYDRYEYNLEVLEIYDVSEEIENSRTMEFLDSCRNEYYPDDVLVYLVRDGLQPEGCWVRITGLGDNFIVGTLLNEPNQNFGYHINDTVAFFGQETKDNNIICISDMNPSKTLTQEDLEDGTLLKNAIEVFNNNRTQDHFIDVLELLRDSYIWIPCNVMISDEDVENILNTETDHIFTSTDDIRLIPDILENNGQYFFPVFTSMEEMGEYGESFSKIEKHLLEAISLARNNERDISGIVVNAFTDPFILDKDLFDLIEQSKSRIQ